MQLHKDRIEREDLVLFINACLSATSQAEFYEDAKGQSLALDFLHEYVCRHYRPLYSRTLAAGINDHARARIVTELLCGADKVSKLERATEAKLVATTLARMPPQRVYRLFERVCERRVTNRRVRAVVSEWLATRDMTFDAVKYRRALRTIVGHFHLRTAGEIGRFLFERHTRDGRYETALFERWRAAHYAATSVFELPYSVAVGFARKHKIAKDEFLEKIAPMMTRSERFRTQLAAQRAEADVAPVELSKEAPTRIAQFAFALAAQERGERRDELLAAMDASVARVCDRSPMRLGRVVAVLDNSYSTVGSREKRMRPLAVTVAIDALLRSASRAYTGLWTSAPEDSRWIDVEPRGSTRLAWKVLDALEHKPELVVIVSDGYENDPPGALASVLSAYRASVDPKRTVSIVHVNPVFEAASFGAASFGPAVPMVSVRGAEDVLTALGFARFADDKATLDELARYLDGRVEAFLGSMSASQHDDREDEERSSDDAEALAARRESSSAEVSS
ncbi:MAG: hypothetical protein JNK05_35095 [Myxococcales bacterium]|nr:hypothetical protein [Myxococcales bacterium]